METTQLYTDRWVDKQVIVDIHNAIFHTLRKIKYAFHYNLRYLEGITVSKESEGEKQMPNNLTHLEYRVKIRE